MARIVHPVHGTVSERSFPAASVSDQLKDELGSLKSSGAICEFDLDASSLTLKRPWVEGENLEESFRRVGARSGRFSGSRSVLARTFEQLAELGGWHGSLHARNIIFSKEGNFVLVDRLMNRTRLGPWAPEAADYWLWGHCLPDDWLPSDWDRVSLLRTAALLCAGPETWGTTHSADQAVALCREWAAEITSAAEDGDVLLPKVNRAVGLLDRIVTARFSRVSTPQGPGFSVEDELDGLRSKQGARRILGVIDEQRLRAKAHQGGMQDEADLHIEAWLIRQDFRREREVAEIARGLLLAGRVSGTKLASSRACGAAEAAWTHFGATVGEARSQLRALLAEEGLHDERDELLACRDWLRHRNDWAPPYQPKLSELTTALAAQRGDGPETARHLLELETERAWITSGGPGSR